MAGNEERPVIEAASPNLALMTQAIVKPDITGHFELKHCMARPYSEIQILLNNFTANDNNWQGDGEPQRVLKQKAAGLIELDEFSVMRADIASLANQMNKMTMHQAQQMQHVQQMSTCCELCSEGHTSDICPMNPESIYYVGQQARGPMNQNAQYGNTCNPNWRNHPNFSWAGNQNIRPQANYNGPPHPPQQADESLTDMMKKLLIENQQLRTEFRNLERQFGQMANNHNTRPVGALPSDIEPNPKAQVNAVTLINGRELEEVPQKQKYTSSPEGELVPKPVEDNKKENKGSDPEIVTRPLPLFPQRLQKQKDDAMYKKFLDILSQVRVNLPLVEILQEVHKYARYLRDIVANKRRHTKFETIALTEECSARVQSKLPPKLKDPGCFTILLSLGKQEVGRVLCDLGASINLMPSSLFKQLGFGVLRPTTITLQLADRSIVMPEGIIEDVLVRVGKFILPADFIILDYEADEEVPIILGRPFLATGGALIDVREGKLKMRVGDEEITFNVYKTLKLHKHYEDLCMITAVELKGIEQSPYANYSDSDETSELEEVVLQAECVRMIEKIARDERGDLLRACKKARLNGRKKKRKHPA
nr:uncharacterized protein LOC104111685 [Nicotiana tomentosiformis]